MYRLADAQGFRGAEKLCAVPTFACNREEAVDGLIRKIITLKRPRTFDFFGIVDDDRKARMLKPLAWVVQLSRKTK